MKGNLSVAQINLSLDKLCESSDRLVKKSVIKALLKNTTPIEQKWLIRIILKGAFILELTLF